MYTAHAYEVVEDDGTSLGLCAEIFAVMLVLSNSCACFAYCCIFQEKHKLMNGQKTYEAPEARLLILAEERSFCTSTGGDGPLNPSFGGFNEEYEW